MDYFGVFIVRGVHEVCHQGRGVYVTALIPTNIYGPSLLVY